MKKLLRGAFVIGRRDFSATVLSKTFLFFLLGPLFPLLFGGIFGGIGASVASSRERPVVAVVASQAEFAQIGAARDRLAKAMDADRVVRLARFEPEPDLAAQQKRLLANRDPPVQAVLTKVEGPAQLTGAVRPDGTTAGQLRLILADLAEQGALPSLKVTRTETSSGSLSRDQATTGQVGQMVLFFLTLLLSTMLLSQLVEEKSNKIIEVVAAAVPIESLFVGKLFAMLAASILGLVVWTAAGAGVIASLKAGGLATLPPPALGWPAFLTLTVVYFAMNYLLLGAVFLTIGAQASTVREVQTLSMPVTFGQVLIFGFAATAVGAPNSGLALGAAIFPLSSPLAMVAPAAQRPDIWPHVAAIVWQMLWVGVILRLGSGLFRKTVLKSGPSGKWWRFSRA
ncbi:MAG: ABC transporter permease [Sphingomicrobium sp.]